MKDTIDLKDLLRSQTQERDVTWSYKFDGTKETSMLSEIQMKDVKEVTWTYKIPFFCSLTKQSFNTL